MKLMTAHSTQTNIKWKRILAGIATISIFFSNISLPVLAGVQAEVQVQEGAEQTTITETTPQPVSFSALAKEVTVQTVAPGTELSSLNLPTELSANVNGEVVQMLVTWQSTPAYTGAIGTYVFTPVLAKNYILADKVLVPSITVTINQLEILTTSGEASDFNIEGGVYDTDYAFDETNKTLTIKTNTELTISNKKPAVATTHKIVVASGVKANIILAGVNIDVSNTENVCAFEIVPSASAKVTLQNKNTLKSGRYKAGLQVPENAAVEINGTGELNATGGRGGMYGAGIGGGWFGSGGTFTTTATGNAFIRATSIQNKKDKANWSGVIIIDKEGKVYKNIILETNAEIPAEHIVTISEDTTLTIAEGVTLTNNGAIHAYGEVDEIGMIKPNKPLKGAKSPKANPKAGSYEGEQKVELRSTTDDATIYYTLDGKMPTTESSKYSKAIPINTNTGTNLKLQVQYLQYNACNHGGIYRILTYSSISLANLYGGIFK